jgi:energy-coupling factor transport system substrate-specific component
MLVRRSRDFTTATLSLMAVAIAINITVGSLTALLRLPLYLDSVGTVLVGALAGPWAGALTGLLSNLVWSLLPIPGGAGPATAFFAPVAATVGLLAGFWASRGVFGLRSDDDRIGGFLALAVGIGAAAVAMLFAQATIGLGFDAEDADSQVRFAAAGVAIVAIGAGAAWVSGRTVFRLRGEDPRIRGYLVGATTIAAAALVFALVRLLFAPAGYFSSAITLVTNEASDPVVIDLTGLALPDPLGVIVALALAAGVAGLAFVWARRGEHARLFPVWVGGFTTGIVAACIAAPIAAGVFGGVTGGGTDLVVALFRTLGLGVFQSVLAQGLTSDPLDKTISFTVVFVILTALPITVRTMFSRGDQTIEA